ncbi:hypothetical protein EV183_004038 [Coemansia sp. RSA 2336]|nr:hypothetical protein EV183_004038 [Coemansia sp. RSA 2336]
MANIVPSKLKVAELRKELSKRKLPTDGRRNDLVERLTAALDKADEETQPEAEAETGTAAENEADDQIDLLPVDEQNDMALEPAEDAAREAAQQVEEQPAEQMEVEGVEAENERKRRHDETDVAMSNEQDEAGVMDAVFIKNLERPLTKYRMREELEKFGVVEDVWLNSIKTRGYASFGSAEQAEAASGKLNGMQFPPEHGRVLESGLITRKRMKELIEEEDARSDEVHTIDLVAVAHEGSNCGVALMSKQGKGPAKRQKTGEARRQADKVEPAPMLVAAAASAAQSRKSSQESVQNELPKQAEAGGELRYTKTEPQISYRLLTDAEVAAKKSH